MLHKSGRGWAKEEAERCWQSASEAPHAVWGCMHDKPDLLGKGIAQFLQLRRTISCETCEVCEIVKLTSRSLIVVDRICACIFRN